MLTNRVSAPLVSWLLTIGVLAVASVARADDRLAMVVCAPGYPGSTAEAQPAMDGLAAAVTVAAGWGSNALEASYFETEDGGVARIESSNVGLTLVTLPFFLEHRAALDLRPRLLAIPSGRQALESWALVAGAGAVKRPADLDGWELFSLAGHSPRFVRGPALGDWGELPESLTITFSGALLSGLRRAAKGEKVAMLLDADQTASLDRLPFAENLEVVHRSPALPVSVVCSVDERVAPDRLRELIDAFEGLSDRPEAAEALAGVRLDRFEPVDSEALDRAERAFSGVAE
jgi:hypothetical protein